MEVKTFFLNFAVCVFSKFQENRDDEESAVASLSPLWSTARVGPPES